MIAEQLLIDLGFEWHEEPKGHPPERAPRYWRILNERGEIRYGTHLSRTQHSNENPELWVYSGLGGEDYAYRIEDPGEHELRQIIDALT